MKRKMVSKKTLAKAISRNMLMFNRKVSEKEFDHYVDVFHEFLPLMTEEQFKKVDKHVLTNERFFPTLSDYSKSFSEVCGWK